jgi:hypothetical protein
MRVLSPRIENRDLLAGRHQIHAELIDERRFAGAWHAADADADAAARVGQDLV